MKYVKAVTIMKHGDKKKFMLSLLSLWPVSVRAKLTVSIHCSIWN